MGTVAKKRKHIVVAIVIIALLLIFAWILLQRPHAKTVAIEGYTPLETAGDYKPVQIGEGLLKIAEDEKTILWLDQDTGGIAIEDVASGERVYSVPQDAFEDPKAADDIKKQVGSALLMTYYNIRAQKTIIFDSYTNAVNMNQISYALLKDGTGASIKMVLGREDSALLIPEQISATRFEELKKQVEETTSTRAAKKMASLYLRYTYKDASDEQKSKYPALKDMDIYVLKSSANNKNKEDLEEYFGAAGYTYEQMELDYAELGYVSKTESFPCFKVYMDYRLEDGVVKVDLPAGNIEYDRDSFILTNVSLFPFMAAGKTGEEGYMVLPDGSGSIVPFNNEGTANSVLTTGKTYGPDAADSTIDRGSTYHEFRYPVFGVKTGEHAIFGIVTRGDAVSQINCQVGNISHSYNTAYADFTISQNAQYGSVSFEQAPWIQYDRNGYQGMISLEYYLLSGEDADYAGMAQIYGEYLTKNHVPVEKEENSEVPLMLDTIGTAGNYTRVLGIPGYRNVAVTTYEEATDILHELQNEGINRVGLRYLAWCNGGYYTYPTTKLEPEKKAGSTSDIKKLQKTVDELGGELFMDLNFLTADRRRSFDPTYVVAEDGIRSLFQKQAYYPFFYTPLQMVEGWDWCINPKRVLSYFSDVTKKYQKLGVHNISVGTVGEVLNSNYKKSDYTNRQESEEIVKELLRQAEEQYSSILVDSGNAYALEYANYVLNLPTDNSNYLVESKSVPFIQMALHGEVVYAGNPLNLSENYEKDVLKSIEYGCAPYFKLCATDGALLKNTYIFDKPLYNVEYSEWKDKMIAAYQKINSALSGVTNARMVDHEELEENVFVTKYDNGTQIYVNYTNQDVSCEGVKISAMDYAVVERGAGGHE
ncbi:MAG: hypothetical protein K6G30_02295 [Acetatifactor sp.]|nr:hypothetical protein [Acetatifactor sp.]